MAFSLAFDPKRWWKDDINLVFLSFPWYSFQDLGKIVFDAVKAMSGKGVKKA